MNSQQIYRIKRMQYHHMNLWMQNTEGQWSELLSDLSQFNDVSAV